MKKGQSSVYVIIGLIVLAWIAIAIYNYNSAENFNSVFPDTTFSFEKESLNNYIKDCLQESFESALQNTDKSHLETYVENRAKSCITDAIILYTEKGIQFENPDSFDIEVEDADNGMSYIVRLNYPLLMKKGDSTSEFDLFIHRIRRTIDASIPTDDSGRVKEDTKIFSEDSHAILNIPEGIVALNSDGTPIKKISMQIGDSPFDPNSISFVAYNLLPDGAEFSGDGIELILDYSDAVEGKDWDEDQIRVSWYDEDNGEYVELETEIIPELMQVKAKINHFSTFGLMKADGCWNTVAVKELNASIDDAQQIIGLDPNKEYMIEIKGKISYTSTSKPYSDLYDITHSIKETDGWKWDFYIDDTIWRPDAKKDNGIYVYEKIITGKNNIIFRFTDSDFLDNSGNFTAIIKVRRDCVHPNVNPETDQGIELSDSRSIDFLYSGEGGCGNCLWWTPCDTRCNKDGKTYKCVNLDGYGQVWLNEDQECNEALFGFKAKCGDSSDPQTIEWCTKKGWTTIEFGDREVVFDSRGDSCNSQDFPDMPPRAYIRDDGKFILHSGHSEFFNSVGDNMDDHEKVCGNNNIVFSPTNDHNDYRSYNAREYLVVPYTLDGTTVYGLVHSELHGFMMSRNCVYEYCGCASGIDDNCWWNSINHAISYDGGRHFVQSDPVTTIANSPIDFNPYNEYGSYGYFNPSNIIYKDGYYYSMMFRRQGPDPYLGTAIMRTDKLEDPTSWKFWASEEEGFVNSGDGGTFPEQGGAILPWSPPSNYVSYNEYLGSYLSIDAWWGGTNLKTSLSEDLIHWTPGSEYEFDDFSCNYLALLQPGDETRNFEISDRSPWLYSLTCSNGCKTGCADGRRKLSRIRIRFTSENDIGKEEYLDLRFSEHTGTKTLDSSFYSNNAQIIGPAEFMPDDHYLHLPEDSYLIVDDDDTLDTEGKLFFYIRFRSSSVFGEYQPLMQKETGSRRHLGMYLTPEGKFLSSFKGKYEYQNAVSSSILNDGNWHEVIVIYDEDSGHHQIYVDNVLESDMYMAKNLLSESHDEEDLAIGKGFEGDIDRILWTNYIAIETSCNDGIDNDDDGNIDCLDKSCQYISFCNAEYCDNRIDDDGDGQIDCFDPDCYMEKRCNKICNEDEQIAFEIENYLDAIDDTLDVKIHMSEVCGVPVSGIELIDVINRDRDCNGIADRDEGYTDHGSEQINVQYYGDLSIDGFGSDTVSYSLDLDDSWVDNCYIHSVFACSSKIGDQTQSCWERRIGSSLDIAMFYNQVEICDNEIDDDGNGYIDLDDPFCADLCLHFDWSGIDDSMQSFMWEYPEVQQGRCCGNGPHGSSDNRIFEYYKYFDVKNDDPACDNQMDNDCIPLSDDSSIGMCCNSNLDCYYDGRCIDQGTQIDFDGDGGWGEWCNGNWQDLDDSFNKYISLGKCYEGNNSIDSDGDGIPYNDEDMCSYLAGEDDVGEYNNQIDKECCGDDGNEYPICNPFDPTDCACCDNRRSWGGLIDGKECVKNGVCTDDIGISSDGNKIRSCCISYYANECDYTDRCLTTRSVASGYNSCDLEINTGCGTEKDQPNGCYDGIDNDCDGFVDLDDTDCCNECISAGYMFSIGAAPTGCRTMKLVSFDEDLEGYCCGDDADEDLVEENGFYRCK